MIAYFVSNLMNVNLTSPITPNQLLDPIRGNEEQKKQDDEAYLRETFKHVLEK